MGCHRDFEFEPFWVQTRTRVHLFQFQFMGHVNLTPHASRGRAAPQAVGEQRDLGSQCLGLPGDRGRSPGGPAPGSE